MTLKTNFTGFSPASAGPYAAMDMAKINGVLSGQKGRFMHSAMDDATAGGLAFLVGELEKTDPYLYEPLTSVTWQRDIYTKTGGGFVNTVSSIAVGYGSSGAGEEALLYNGGQDIPVSQAEFIKDRYRTFIFAMNMQVSYFDQEMLAQIPRNIQEMYDTGIKLNWNKLLDLSTYRGMASVGTYGLLNNPNIVSYTVADNGADDPSTLWKDKTPAQILADVNDILTKQWKAVEYDRSGMANQLLISPENYSYIVSQMVSLAADKSILTYLLENCIAKNQQIDLKIEPCRQATGAGTGTTNRMLAYCNRKERVHFEMTVPLQRVMTSASVERLAYLTSYAGQFSEIKFLYPQTMIYADGI